MTREEWMTFLKKSLRFLPDKTYTKLYYRLRVGRKLDMDNPHGFNEKIQWLKFNCYFPLMSEVSDKCAVRSYVAEKIGEQYLIPEYGEWDHFDEIDFEKLPNQFVLKCNHDSGGLVICKDKASLDMEKARKKIESSLKSNFFYVGRERQYLYIKPRILCEAFLSDQGEVPKDYKIFCFNGKPDCIMVCRNRFKESHRATYSFFDLSWNFLPYTKGDTAEKASDCVRPENLQEMIEIAKKLCQDFTFARIDLYNVNGKVYFGEITLSPNSGFDSDLTYEADMLLGEKLDLKELMEKKRSKNL